MVNRELLLQAEGLWKALIKKATGSEEDIKNKLNLASGASDADFLEVEKELKVDLPDEMKAIYSVHNGQMIAADGTALVPDMKPLVGNRFVILLYDTKTVIEQWRWLNSNYEKRNGECDADERVKPVLWNTKWIPVMEGAGGGYFCLDTDPAAGGTPGQVIYLKDRSVKARGIFDFFKLCAEKE